jgi:hypothetical protein
MTDRRRLLPALLLTLALLDLTRCGLLLGSSRTPLSVPLLAASVAAAMASFLGARAYRGSRRWAGAAALVIGIAAAPQAAAAGFRTPFTWPDLASLALGAAIAVAVLASGMRETEMGS